MCHFDSANKTKTSGYARALYVSGQSFPDLPMLLNSSPSYTLKLHVQPSPPAT